jgi:hypothetical protein
MKKEYSSQKPFYFVEVGGVMKPMVRLNEWRGNSKSLDSESSNEAVTRFVPTQLKLVLARHLSSV